MYKESYKIVCAYLALPSISENYCYMCLWTYVPTHTYTLLTPTHTTSFLFEQNCHYPQCKYLLYWYLTFLLMKSIFYISFCLNKTLYYFLQKAKIVIFLQRSKQELCYVCYCSFSTNQFKVLKPYIILS